MIPKPNNPGKKTKIYDKIPHKNPETYSSPDKRSLKIPKILMRILQNFGNISSRRPTPTNPQARSQDPGSKNPEIQAANFLKILNW